MGIILFGSWARGKNRLDSDVDLVVIVTEGFRRTVEYNNEVFFDLRGQWIPSPKQRLSQIKNASKEFYALLEQFYKDDVALEEKLHIARKMIPIVFHM